jgi:xanthine dehydrogenase YagT iron-sulfur-binding subunit
MTDQAIESIDRRNFMTLASGAAVAGPLTVSTSSGAQPSNLPRPNRSAGVSFTLNGQVARVDVDPRTTLLDTLREHLGQTGSKKGCDHGQCGACTVLVDGKRVLSCLTLAVSAEGQQVTTIEGLASAGGALHPMQQAFVDHDAFQCGYCTPGQIMSAVGCVKEGHANSDAEIREYMSGNLCRCAAYPNIVAAVRQARDVMGV